MLAATSDGLHAPHLFVDAPVLVVAAVLAVGVMGAGLAERVRVPSLLVFLGAGMLVADDGLGLVHFDDTKLAQNLAVVALVAILFDGGLSTSMADVRRAAVPATALATLGTAITTGVVAAVASGILGVDGSTALVIGAVVASTDAAAVFAAAKHAPIPHRVAAVLEVESGINDPMAVLLTVGFVVRAEHAVTAADWLVFGARQLLLGAAVGLAVGWVGGQLVARARLGGGAGQPLLATAVGAAAYGLAASSGASGFLAVYLAGILVAHLAPRHRRAVRTFHTGLAEAAQIGLFLLLGVLVFPSDLGGVAGKAVAIAAALVLVARPLAAFVCLLPLRWPVRQIVFTSWAGLRGAVPIVLATFALTGGLADGGLVFDVVFFVVVLSVLVQGTTLAPLARRLGLQADRAASSIAVELSPVGSLDADVVEAVLTEHAAVAGRPLSSTRPPRGVRVLLVSRDGRTFPPTGDTVLEPGDHLLVSDTSGHADPEIVTAWLSGGEHTH